MRSKPVSLVSALCGAAFALIGQRAEASEAFPVEIANHLELDCAPTCNLCHQTNAGGPQMTNESLFLRNMANNGLFPTVRESVGPALDAIEQAEMSDDLTSIGGGDSDGDGVLDIAQLREGRNASTGDPLCPIEYGCFARVAREPSQDNVAGAAAALTALALAAAARRRTRRG